MIRVQSPLKDRALSFFPPLTRGAWGKGGFMSLFNKGEWLEVDLNDFGSDRGGLGGGRLIQF